MVNLEYSAINKSEIENSTFEILYIPPVRPFHHKLPVLRLVVRRNRIFAIHNKEIRGRAITPLETGIDVHVLLLIIVLHISGKIQCIGESNVHFRTDQCEPRITVWLWL